MLGSCPGRKPVTSPSAAHRTSRESSHPKSNSLLTSFHWKHATGRYIQRTSSELRGLGVPRSSAGYPTSSLGQNTCHPWGVEQRGATTDRATLISRGIDPPLRWR